MYGEIYYHEYCIEGTEQEARLSILKRDYEDPAIYVEAGPVPFTKSLLNEDGDLVGGIYPTKASVQLVSDENFGMDDLFSADATEFQVIHYVENEVDWIGYIAPEGLGETDTEGIRYLNLNAYDGLTLLKERKFLNAESLNYFTDTIFTTETVIFNIKEALKKTGLELDIVTLCDRVPVPVSSSDDLSMLVDIIPGQNIIYNARFSEFGPLLQAGNYFRYRADYETSYRLTRITEVLTGGANPGIQVDPPFPINISLMWGQILSATGNLNRDALEHARINLRTWIDPSKTPKTEDKEEAAKSYYEFTEGTATCWHVLDTIARTFDMRVVQRNGAWFVEALDAYRIPDEYFRYDYDGVYIGRQERYTVEEIPECGTETHNKISGATRSFDKMLEHVSVSYSYRYKVEGDSFNNLISNGDLNLPPGASTPASDTPINWSRVQLRDPNGNLWPINYSITKTLLNPTEIFTTDRFNQYNRLSSAPIRAVKGDKLSFTWLQSLYENPDAIVDNVGLVMATFLFEFRADNGDVYHLVNQKEQDGWEATGNYWYTSGSPSGQWIKVDRNFYHFNTNYSTARYGGAGWGWSAMSLVNLSTPELPESGTLIVSFVGASYMDRTVPFADEKVRSYIIDVLRWQEDGTLNYIDQPDDGLIRVAWGTSRVRLSGISVFLIPSPDRGEGRVYGFTNDKPYFETLDIPTDLGDEVNDNHISAVIVNSNQTDTWVNRDGSLYMGSLGVLLSRSVMRRYFRPKYLLDGSVTVPLQGVTDTFELESPRGGLWTAKGADYEPKTLSLSGTFTVLPVEILPYNGAEDKGENSLVRGS